MMNIHKKYAWALSALLCLMLMVIAAPAARAKTITPNDWVEVQIAIDGADPGDVIDLTSDVLTSPNAADPVTITVNTNKTITIDGAGKTFENVAFVFNPEGNHITIKNLKIKSANNHGRYSAGIDDGYSPLHFEGTGNTLTLVGDNTITSGQAEYVAGYGAAVGVPKDAALTIKGTGTLIAEGGKTGAGIGGGGGIGGTITIEDCTITAQGGSDSAGIGGGGIGNGGGNTTIGGNAVIEKAIGGFGGAGIGGGRNGGGGHITIGGNAVITLAQGGMCNGFIGGGAGIGGGGGDFMLVSGASGTIAITGNAQVTAKGGGNGSANSHGGAGIGSGGAGNGPGEYEGTYGSVGAVNTITINTTGVVTVTRGEGGDFPGASIGLGGSRNSGGAETIYFTQQPANAVVTEDSITGELMVATAVYNEQSITFSYQWYRNTTDDNTGGESIIDATGDSFTIPDMLAVGTYYYYCVASADGSVLSATSNVAKVTVSPAPPDPDPDPGPKPPPSTGGGPMQPSVVTLTPSMNPYYGLGGLGLTSSGFVGQFRSLSMNGQLLTEGVDYTVENAGGLAVLHVNEAALAGLNGDVRFEAVFSDATASCTVRVQSAAVPEDITTAPPKTGDGAGYTGIALLLFALAGMRVMRAKQGNNTKQMRGINA